jgi:hypothetical protein
MQALTAEIPKPESLMPVHAGVPRTVAPNRTAPIVHAPRRSAAASPSHAPRTIAAAPTPTRTPAPAHSSIDATIQILTGPSGAKSVPAAKPATPTPVATTPARVEATAPARKVLEIRPLPGRPKPRPVAKAPAKPARPKPQPLVVASKPAPAATPIAKLVAKKVEPKRAASPRSTAKPMRSDPAPRKEGESLADRLRRHSAGRREQLAAKVKRIADAEKRRATTDTFDEDATSLWCPEHLALPDDRAAQ